MMNRMQNFMDIAKQARQLQDNPSQVSKMLLDSGRINQSQYDAIKGMNTPTEIGKYLMDNGILGQQQINHLAQLVPRVMQ